MLKTITSLILTFLFYFVSSGNANPSALNHPPLPLAHVYAQGINIKNYWLSEKLDGVRAYWNGKQLLSKQGNVYHAPTWFVANFPAQPLDGELWIKRNSFERIVSIVRDKKPGDGWQEIRYMVFDLPLKGVVFTDRIRKLKTLLSRIDNRYLHLVEQSRISGHDALMTKLDDIVDAGGEGLMLHNGNALYLAGRSNDLLKVKSYQDAEARVIAHLPGKGKFKGMLGALLVETSEGKRFRLGSGFSNHERQSPPPIDTFVSYKYYGKTINGLPRFASFLRIRALK
ncbi:MAG: DNA ligase [Gammaproteobacteria bacterium]|nr:DNA ligase [Gammaproteobacteria bacterium]